MTARRSLRSRIGRFGVLGLNSKPDSCHFPAPESAEKPKKVSVAVPIAYSALSERQFQRIVRACLEQFGYVVWAFPEMRMTAPGVPDLLFWHPRRPGRFWAYELKSVKGRVRPEQREAIEHLATVPGIDAQIVRPADWPALRDELISAAFPEGER